MRKKAIGTQSPNQLSRTCLKLIRKIMTQYSSLGILMAIGMLNQLLKSLYLFSLKLEFLYKRTRNLKTLVLNKKKRLSCRIDQLNRESKKEHRRIEIAKITSRSNHKKDKFVIVLFPTYNHSLKLYHLVSKRQWHLQFQFSSSHLFKKI
jgi:hypothetical protein